MNKLTNYISKNSVSILSWIGIAGAITTGVTAAFSGAKAQKILDEIGEDASKKEKFKAVAPVFILPAIALVGTITAVAGANYASIKLRDSLISTITLMQTTHNKYKTKVREIAGEETYKEINEEFAHEMICEQIPEELERECIGGDFDCIFYENFSGRMFVSTMNNVLDGIDDFKEYLIANEFTTLDTFYSCLNLSGTYVGEDYYWIIDEIIEKHGTYDIGIIISEIPNRSNKLGIPEYLIEFMIEPKADPLRE